MLVSQTYFVEALYAIRWNVWSADSVRALCALLGSLCERSPYVPFQRVPRFGPRGSCRRSLWIPPVTLLALSTGVNESSQRYCVVQVLPSIRASLCLVFVALVVVLLASIVFYSLAPSSQAS